MTAPNSPSDSRRVRRSRIHSTGEPTPAHPQVAAFVSERVAAFTPEGWPPSSDKLPKKQQAEARVLLCAIPYAETRQEAEAKRDAFVEHHYGKAYPSAAEALGTDWERMVAFYSFPKGALEAPANDQRRRVALCFSAPQDLGGEALQDGRERYRAHLTGTLSGREIVP